MLPLFELGSCCERSGMYAIRRGYACQLHVFAHPPAEMSRCRCGLERHAAKVQRELGGTRGDSAF
eukprot:5647809-Pleurochrysis_carterae.AAC.1